MTLRITRAHRIASNAALSVLATRTWLWRKRKLDEAKYDSEREDDLSPTTDGIKEDPIAE